MRFGIAAALVLAVPWRLAGAQVTLAPPSIRMAAGSSVSVAGNVAQTLSDPRQSLVTTFTQQVTYEAGAAPASLHLEVQGLGDAFDQLQAAITVTGIDSMTSLGVPSEPGTGSGTHTVMSGTGPVTLLSGITNIRVTVNVQVTVTLGSRYALSGERVFLFQYTLL